MASTTDLIMESSVSHQISASQKLIFLTFDCTPPSGATTVKISYCPSPEKEPDIWTQFYMTRDDLNGSSYHYYPCVILTNYILYKFIIDDIWMHDEDKPTETDKAGNINNKLVFSKICEICAETAICCKQCCIQDTCLSCIERSSDIQRKTRYNVECMKRCGKFITNYELELVYPNYKQVTPEIIPLPRYRLDYSSKIAFKTSLKILWYTRPCKTCGVRIKKKGGCSHLTCTICETRHSWYINGNYLERFLAFF